MSEEAAPCLILDDDDLQKQSKQIQWRKDDARDINGLFNSTKTVSKFPGAFQTYKKDSGQVATNTRFPFIKGHKKTTPVQKVVDASGIVFTPEFIAEHGVPLLRLPEFVAPTEPDDDPPYATCTPPSSP